MRISLDAGALCVEGNLRFGNYTFTKNLIETMVQYDGENEYFIYSFCQKPDWLKAKKLLHYQILLPKFLWLSARVSVEEIRHKKDLFLALNQAIPVSTSGRIISFTHGLSFHFYPQFYPDSYHALKDHLEPMVKRSSYIVTPSSRVKTEFKKLFPNYKNFVTVNYGVPFDMQSYQAEPRKKYFLFVGMNHPIKNVEFLLKAFRKFRKIEKFQEYKLYLVGDFKKIEDREGGIISSPSTNRITLKKLYSKATAYLTASYYESFNYPVLEALAQNCPVIGLNEAIIPEFKDYIYIAYNSTDFIDQMVEVTQGAKVKVKREDVLKRFTWKKYVAKLKELYRG